MFTNRAPGLILSNCSRPIIPCVSGVLGALTDGQGAFRITGVPPGGYTLKAYHPDLGTVVWPNGADFAPDLSGALLLRAEPVLEGLEDDD